ncbi:hypothetical protein Q0590_00195 [Rhodocytophaga aerolata]|uniref:Helix-turn-helix domain-containing protein n=1 Tax=Rhodocytophaga aerolata TaxID=455078 RepID=A0ABT8R074_9BACT|nr:hypothetical protein [Rhodocytophaga aerolata]MDO1444643.1 hypothetical protein [Rhodocytophaga aerolata]
MAKKQLIPLQTQIKKIDLWQSQKAAFLKIKTYNKGKSYGETVTTSQITTINKILEDYISKFRHHSASKAKLYITMGNLAELAGCCVKTAYNHLLRLMQAGLVKKKLTAHCFDGKTLTPCIEIEIGRDIVKFTEFTSTPYVNNPVDRGKKTKFIAPPISSANMAFYKAGGHIT